MTIQEHGIIESNYPRLSSDEITSEIAVNGALLKAHLARDDSAPKARKPYTITKQRERWTEEEHKKFLEALKLHGRAWRKIEEHVGSKTAVQIRSHAQKFFTKVVRESNIGDSSAEKPIEIPPPRPKRKPMHPYPRKQASAPKHGITIPEKIMSSSTSMSILEQENQSPTSVLSALGSDTSVGEDAYVPNGTESGTPDMSVEARSPTHEYELSSSEEQLSEKPDLLTQNTNLDNGDLKRSTSLKLFGKTLSVKDTQESCDSNIDLYKTESSDKSDETCLFPLMVMPLNFPANDSDSVGNTTQNHLGVATDCYEVPTSWLTLRSGASLPTMEVHNPTPIKSRPISEQREGSSSGSNIDSVECSFERKEKVEVLFSSHKLNKRISANSIDCRKGFVPYKRCLAERDSTTSSSDTVEVQQKQRIRLCL